MAPFCVMTMERARASRAPIIGITSYGRDKKRRFRVSVDYVDAVRRAGGIPLILPPGDPLQDELLDHFDGLILTGGGDIDPALYRGMNHSTLSGLDAERDAGEVHLARRIVDSGKPSLFVCRGAQILNVALGGTLHAHIPEVYGASIRHELLSETACETSHIFHAIDVVEGTLLARVLGEQHPTIASWHHQSVRDVAPVLVVSARAPDGVIEALELPDHPWLAAVQWHPEITSGHDPIQQGLFDAMVGAARRAIVAAPSLNGADPELRVEIPHVEDITQAT